MNTTLLSDVVHLATRLQSAGMIHSANLREFLPGDSIEVLQREAAAIVQLTEKLAFQVAHLRDSVAATVARPRLRAADTIHLTRRVARSDEPLILDITDSNGGLID